MKFKKFLIRISLVKINTPNGEVQKKREKVFCIYSGINSIPARFLKNIVIDNYVLPKEFHFWYNIVLVQFLISYASRWGTILNN